MNGKLDLLLDKIASMKGSDRDKPQFVYENGNLLDTIHETLSSMAAELSAKEKRIEADRKRLEEILEILIDYSVMNFERKATLSDRGDEIDALSAGLNMIAQELEFAIASQKKYSDQLEFANRLLVASNEKMLTILNNAPDAIIACDMSLKITEWNQAAEQMYGFTKEEILGRSVAEIIQSQYISPLTREKAVAEMNSKGWWSGQVLQRTSRVNNKVIHATSSYLKNEQGVPVGYLAVNKDMTEVRKMETELNESEKRYHLLVNEVVDYAIIMLDVNGVITSWNKGAEKIKGYKEEEVVGKHFSIFYTEEDNLKGVPQKALDMAKKEKRYSLEGWRVRKDKSLFWAEVIITELRDEQGDLKGFVKITKDLTDKRKVENEISRTTEDLKRSNTELEQFAYVASHDLQEPLRMITSYVQLLEKHYKDKLDQDGHDFINYAVDGASRMQKLIYSLLEYSRINRIQPFENIDLDDTLHEVMRDLDVAVKEANAKVTWKGLPVIFGDKVLIGQLFFNLIGNAIKFRGSSPPEIAISFKKQNHEFLFAVKDNGIGIKKEYREKIFVIFQRLHSKDKYSGTGIGLAICKKIVERHNGTIWVESEPDKGSTFYFTISSDLKSPTQN